VSVLQLAPDNLVGLTATGCLCASECWSRIYLFRAKEISETRLVERTHCKKRQAFEFQEKKHGNILYLPDLAGTSTRQSLGLNGTHHQTELSHHKHFACDTVYLLVSLTEGTTPPVNKT
jgi:hypothetical protein